MSAPDYDETDPEIQDILEGVVKPSEDPLAAFDSYQPRYEADESFLRGYQYSFPSSRGIIRSSIVPTLDDQSSMRLRRSQEAIWEDSNYQTREGSSDSNSKSEQYEDGGYGSRRVYADYSTDESTDYDDGAFPERPRYPTERTGLDRAPVAMMTQSGPSFRRPQPQRPTTNSASSLFMEDSPLFHLPNSNNYIPQGPSNGGQRPLSSQQPQQYYDEEAYYDELEYEEEYRHSHDYGHGRGESGHQRYGGPSYQSPSASYGNPPYARRYPAPGTTTEHFRQSHIPRVRPPRQGGTSRYVPEAPQHRSYYDSYSNSNTQYQNQSDPEPYNNHPQYYRQSHLQRAPPPSDHYHSRHQADPRHPYPQDPRHQTDARTSQGSRYPEDPRYSHDSRRAHELYSYRGTSYSEPEYEYDTPYEQNSSYPNNRNALQRPSHRHSPVKIFTRGPTEDYTQYAPQSKPIAPYQKRSNPLPYSSQLPDYLNPSDGFEPVSIPSVKLPSTSHGMIPYDHPNPEQIYHARYLPQERFLPRQAQSVPLATATATVINPSISAPPRFPESHAPPPPNVANLPAHLAATLSVADAQKQLTKNSASHGQTKTRTPSPIPDKMQLALKAKLQLSPATKAAFKDFFKEYKNKEREGFQAAKMFAAQHFQLLPEKVHWKIYLEVADLAKRENKFKEAAKYYEKVNLIQPFAAKGWLEYAKMMEESGDLDECTRILTDGLYFCPQNENLLVKGIKHAERINNIALCRVLLARLKNVSMDRSWRTVMEGGLLEARQGNIVVARQIFKYLFEHVPLYGPVYIEAIQMEMKRCEYERAVAIVDLGIEKCPTYGPLWLLAIQVEEYLGRDFEKRLNDSLPYLSKELVWKMYFEAAQFYESRNEETKCFDAYVKAVLTCPTNVLLWRIWSGGARTAIHFNKPEMAHQLLLRAYSVVPAKMKPSVLIDSARFEEYLLQGKEARRILKKAKRENSNDWKAFLESVLLEMRSGDLQCALEQVKEALEIHNSTGRLWAMFINLSHLVAMERAHLVPYDQELQTAVFVEALGNVPKSGEVWCEGARLAMRARLFPQARKFLEFAVQFTPQYGDSFIELLRLEFLERIVTNNDLNDLSTLTEDVYAEVERLCINSEPSYGVSWSFSRHSLMDNPRQTLRHAYDKFLRLCEERVRRFGSRPASEEVKSESKPSSCESDHGVNGVSARHYEILLKTPDDFVTIDLDLLASFLGKGEDFFNRKDPDVRFRSIFI